MAGQVLRGGSIEINGIKQTINALNRIDKELVKAFKENVNRLSQPAIDATGAEYRAVGLPISGMAYTWGRESKSGRITKLFPYDADKAAAGLAVKYDTRRGAVGVIVIQQKNPAAAIFEVAGRTNLTNLGVSLDQESGRGYKIARPGRTRIMGPAIYRATRRGVTDEIRKLVKDLEETLSRKLASQNHGGF